MAKSLNHLVHNEQWSYSIELLLVCHTPTGRKCCQGSRHHGIQPRQHADTVLRGSCPATRPQIQFVQLVTCHHRNEPVVARRKPFQSDISKSSETQTASRSKWFVGSSNIRSLGCRKRAWLQTWTCHEHVDLEPVHHGTKQCQVPSIPKLVSKSISSSMPPRWQQELHICVRTTCNCNEGTKIWISSTYLQLVSTSLDVLVWNWEVWEVEFKKKHMWNVMGVIAFAKLIRIRQPPENCTTGLSLGFHR